VKSQHDIKKQSWRAGCRQGFARKAPHSHHLPGKTGICWQAMNNGCQNVTSNNYSWIAARTWIRVGAVIGSSSGDLTANPTIFQNARPDVALSTIEIRQRDSLLIGIRLLLLLLLTLAAFAGSAGGPKQRPTRSQWLWLITTSALLGVGSRALENLVWFSFGQTPS